MKVGSGIAITTAFGCTLAAGACAHTPERARATCLQQPVDSAFLAVGPVHRACEVARPASLQYGGTRPNYMFETPPATSCIVTELEFVVDTLGVPEVLTAKVLRADHPELARAIVATLATWRYRPARDGGRPVRQIVRTRRSIAVLISRPGVPGPPPRAPSSC